jgi:tetratricopeptide (TPR) repeat protein
LGREQSDGALVVLNNWGISMHNAGVPRRALELLDESIRIEGQRGPDIELTATVVGNRGQALQALGRFQQARAAFDEECRLAISHDDELGEMHCLLGESSVSVMLGELGDAQQLDDAQRYLDRFGRLLQQAGAPPDSPPARAHLLLQSRLDLARGKVAEARRGFERVIIERPHDAMNLDAYLGISMTALAANDAAQAVEFARRAMPIAVARQGDLRYSHYVGTTSLWLGRALLRAGDRVEGRNALEAAVAHLSNTIDADHPNLLQARAELRDAQLSAPRTARTEQNQQHAER